MSDGKGLQRNSNLSSGKRGFCGCGLGVGKGRLSKVSLGLPQQNEKRTVYLLILQQLFFNLMSFLKKKKKKY